VLNVTSAEADDVADPDQTERSCPAWPWRASAGSVSSASSSPTKSLRYHTAHKLGPCRRATADAGYECFSYERQTCRTDIQGSSHRSDVASSSPHTSPSDAGPTTDEKTAPAVLKLSHNSSSALMTIGHSQLLDRCLYALTPTVIICC